MAGDSLSQAATFYSTLTSFFLAESQAAATSPTAPAPGEFRDYTGAIDYSELLRMALYNQKETPTFMNGAAVDTVHHAAAVLREYNMCIRNKAAYIISRGSDASAESVFFTRKGQQVDAQLRGRGR